MRKSVASLTPYFSGDEVRCNALRMITGNAVLYLRALARCTPPHPVVRETCPDCALDRCTRKYSVMHWRKRIREGMLIMKGTQNAPPQLRFGGPVLLCPEEKNMHSETNKSPSTLAYDVSASASRMSPNFPSAASAMPPMDIRFNVASVLLRPARETKGSGAIKPNTRTRR